MRVCVSLYCPLRYASRLRSKFSIRVRTVCGAGMLRPLWELGRFTCRSMPCVRIAGMARSYRYQMLLQTMYQILRQLRLQFVDRDGDAEFAGLRHAQSGIAARVDVGERGQGHIHIESQAVIAIIMAITAGRSMWIWPCPRSPTSPRAAMPDCA